MLPRRAVPLLLTAVLAAATAGALTPAAAHETDAAGEAVTIFLKAPDLAGLRQLAAADDMSHAARLAALSRLVPSATDHAAVARSLRASGFRITGETSWSITAIGPQSTAQALFGTRPVATARSSRAQVRAATGALPRIPAMLRASVSAVFPTVGGPAAFHAATSTLAGRGFRNAYTAAAMPPSTGLHDGSATVATLQLANFYGTIPGDFNNSRTASDLTKYAQQHGIADPVANGHYKAVKIDGGPKFDDDSTGGDIEVNLDQQSILSTAPSAHQQAYFAPNTNAGFNDVFAHVYDDVVGNKYATAKNPHIVAMSSSWGECESLTGRKLIATLEPILASLTAAGVTVFSSSGDAGIYDCASGGHTADVDYPGSSPYVLSVGGTYLHAATNAPNKGKNWLESAWTCGDASDCQSQFGNGGSGGGKSGEAYAPDKPDSFAGFPVPLYQRVAINNEPFRGTTKRLVPDLAADGAPRSGFVIYSSDAGQCACTGNATIGGTSLSSPVSAALLTNALAGRHRFRGVGDIHGALYSAYHNRLGLPATNRYKAVRDIVVGRNGAAADRSTDPSVRAQKGYDTVTGVGSVYWPVVTNFVLDPHHPVVTGLHFFEPYRFSTDYRTITAQWTVARGADLRLLGATYVLVKRLGARTSRARYVFPSSGSRSFTGVPGATYRLTVQARDIGRRQSGPATRLLTVPLDDRAFHHGPAWSRRTNPGDIGGSHLVADRSGAALTAAGRGRSYALRVRTGPNAGRIGVFLHGHQIRTLDLHRARHGVAMLAVFSGARAGRTFTFRALDNRPVSLDALVINY
jgi:kumamolisin